MFYVKIKIAFSEIHGLGLFADENIPQGSGVYSTNSDLDMVLSPKEYDAMDSGEKRTIQHYGYLSKVDGNWHLSFDDIRFCNHDSGGNLTAGSGELIAKRDIKKGEEITQDYREFEKLREGLD